MTHDAPGNLPGASGCITDGDQQAYGRAFMESARIMLSRIMLSRIMLSARIMLSVFIGAGAGVTITVVSVPSSAYLSPHAAMLTSAATIKNFRIASPLLDDWSPRPVPCIGR